MHYKNIKPNILCLITNEFSNSLIELKEHLSFEVIIFDQQNNAKITNNYELVIIDENVVETLPKELIKGLDSKDKILLSNSKDTSKINFIEKIQLPFNISQLNNSVKKIITSKKFAQNSSIRIKNYILDKNEKKLRKDNVSVTITEKEVQLVELLFNSKKPLIKKKILNVVWNYSTEADTHTVETHIYRLRKKILENFDDDSFILNTKEGYII